MHGKDIEIPKGHEITVYTNTDYAVAKASLANAPKPVLGTALTNADVLKLKEAGLSEQLIVDKIKASVAKYQLDTNDLLQLKQAGLSDAVVSAMIQASQR
jgi:hypothetical protein